MGRPFCLPVERGSSWDNGGSGSDRCSLTTLHEVPVLRRPTLRFPLGLAVLGAWTTAVTLVLFYFRDPIRYNAFGDWVAEGWPVFQQLGSGHLFSVFTVPQAPMMLPISYFVRLPAYWLTLPLSGDTRDHYLTGSLLMVFISGLLVAWAANMLADLRGAVGRWQRWIIVGSAVAIAIGNPLSRTAVIWGHPEEIFMMALLAVALAALVRQRLVLSAIMLGLACATKQPAMLLAPLLFVAVPAGRRMRFTAIASATLLLGVLPWTWRGGDYPWARLIATQLHASRSPGESSYVWTIWRVLPSTSGYEWLSHYLIIAVALLLPLGLWLYVRRTALAPARLLLLATSLMLLRSILDAVNIVYYVTPVVAPMLLLELYLLPRRQRYVPVATLLYASTLAFLSSWSPLYDWIDQNGSYQEYTYAMLTAGGGIVLAFAGLMPQRLADRIATVFANADDTSDPSDADGATAAPPAWRRRRVLYGALALTVAFFGVGWAIQQSHDLPPLKAPTQAYGFVPAQVVSGTPPSDAVRGWWLGQRVFGLRDSSAVFVADPGSTEFRESNAKLFAVVVSPDATQVSVTTAEGDALVRRYRALVADCRGKCERVLDTPLGKGALTIDRVKNNRSGNSVYWSVMIPVNDTQLVIVSSLDDLDQQRVVDLLKPVVVVAAPEAPIETAPESLKLP